MLDPDRNLDSYEILVYNQVLDELEWTVEYWPCRSLHALYYCVCHALIHDVVCRLSGNLDADL